MLDAIILTAGVIIVGTFILLGLAVLILSLCQISAPPEARGVAATDSVDYAFRKRDLFGYLGEDEIQTAKRDLTRYVESIR